MKRLLSIVLALGMCAALLGSVSAVEAGEEAAPGEEAPVMNFVRVWGKVSPWDGEGVRLMNDSGSAVINDIVVHLGEAPVVDAVTGLPLDMETVKEGDILYVWVGPAMAMSMPPQAMAIAAVGNVPADAAVPEYCEIAGASMAAEDSALHFPLTGGGTLAVNGETAYTPWLTRQIVTADDLTPGARVMVWTSGDMAEKVLVFPYGYQGWLGMTSAGNGDILGCVNGKFDGQTPQCLGKRTADGSPLLPIRAVAEAAGYGVRWDRELGAVVSLNGETVFSAKPGADTIITPEGESGISSPCIIEKGVTYLPAADLAAHLNLYLTTSV